MNSQEVKAISDFYNETRVASFSAHSGQMSTYKRETFVKELGQGRFLVADTKRKYRSGLTLIGSVDALVKWNSEGPCGYYDFLKVKLGNEVISDFMENVAGYYGDFRISNAGKPVFEFNPNGKHMLVRGQARTYSNFKNKNGVKQSAYFGISGLESFLEKLKGTEVFFSQKSLSNGRGHAEFWFVTNR